MTMPTLAAATAAAGGLFAARYLAGLTPSTGGGMSVTSTSWWRPHAAHPGLRNSRYR